MAQWNTSPTWVSPSNINQGNQFNGGDGVIASDLNKIVENLLYLFKNIGVTNIEVGNVIINKLTSAGSEPNVSISTRKVDNTTYLDFTFTVVILSSAKEISYDSSSSGLVATTVQQAIDILKKDTYTKDEVNDLIDQINAGDIDLTGYYTKKETDNLINVKFNEAKEHIDEITDTLVLDIECDHEFEITGQSGHEYSLAIPDESSVKLKKIQGQTRRKSLNLLNIADGKVTLVAENVSYKSVHYTMPCKSNTTYTISIKYNQSANNGHLAIITHYTDENSLGASSGTIFKTLTTSDETEMQFNFYATTVTATTNTINFTEIMVVEGTYTTETIPQFEPYDNTLVNSKCYFVSASKNWFDYANSNYTDSVDINSDFASNPNKSATKNYTLVLPNTNYVLQLFNATAQSYQIYTYDKDKNLISKLIDVGSSAINFTTPSNCYYIRLSQYNGAGNSIKPSSVMLNYGTEAQPYQPHQEDVLPFSIELTKYGLWENGQVIDYGSEKWEWDSLTQVLSSEKYTYGYRLQIVELPNTINGETQGISNWEYNFSMISNPNGDNRNTICVFNKYIYIYVNGATTLTEARAVLDANPPQLIYKQTTPRINYELPFTNIMKVWNSGLQQQKIEGKYLPYILTKEYAISLKAQVDNNTTENYLQDARIKENKAEIENLKTASVDYTRVYISEEGIYLNEKIRDVEYELDNMNEKISFIANNTTAKATKSASTKAGTTQGIDGTYPTTITANILKYLTITPTATKGANVSEVTQVQYDSQTGVCTINVEATSPSRLTGVTIEYTYSMEILWQNRDNLSVLAEEE